MATLDSAGLTSIDRQPKGRRGMPFVVVQRGDQWCVYTQGSDGRPTGETHGCHSTEAAARQQQKALYANVPEAKKAGTKPSEKEGGHRSPPAGYPESRDQYADPSNYRYRLDDSAHARNALSRWGDASNRSQYSAEEQAYVLARILAACRKFGVEVSQGSGKRATMDSEYLITVGPAVKAMGGGRVGGYLVQWGDEESADADGEFFTADTDFDTEFPAKASIFYHHGLDRTIGRRRLGRGEMKLDAAGIWMEGQLDLQDAYLARIYEMARAGKLGWSSGAVAHLTDPPRESPGGAIKSWPLKEASLTPIPSDRRNTVVALKSCTWPEFEELTGLGAEPDLPPSLTEDLDRVADYVERVARRCSGIKIGQAQFSRSRRERLARLRDELAALLEELQPSEESAPDITTPDPGPGGGGVEMAAPPRIAVPLADLDISHLYAAALREVGAAPP